MLDEFENLSVEELKNLRHFKEKIEKESDEK